MAYDPSEARDKGKFSKAQGAGAAQKPGPSFKLPRIQPKPIAQKSLSLAQPKAAFLPAPPQAEKLKFIGQKVGKAEHVFAANVEQKIAQAVGGKWMEDNEEYDAEARRGGLYHGIEVKSLLKGSKQSLSVHDDALLRKVNWVKEDPDKRVYHTIAWDHRDHYDGGKYKENYSGNALFYKRGSGAYTLSSMYKVKDLAELSSLIGMKDKDLPEAARGSLPKGKAIQALKQRAEKVHVSRLLKDRARKARIKQMKLQGVGVP